MTTSAPKLPGTTATTPMDHATRYESAAEFVQVVQGSQDSWEEGAITTNVETGEYFDKTKVHTLDHVGKFYSVRGPLNVTRTPQGQPVLVQGGSFRGRKEFCVTIRGNDFLCLSMDKEHAKCFLRDDEGQGLPNAAAIRSTAKFFQASCRSLAEMRDARKKLSELMRLAVPAVALKMLSARFGHDMSRFDLDGPMPNLPPSNEIQTHAKMAYEKARKANLTLRDFTIRWPWPAVTCLHAETRR